jgi:hypothetical protein
VRAGGCTTINDLAVKTRYSFELWDLCGTSYAPFPFDAPWLMRKTKCISWLLNSHNACPATVTQAQHGLRFASIEQKVGLLEQCPTSALVMARNRMIGVAE